MPKWVNNAIIYHIFIDRFAGCKYPEKWNMPDFVGGNIKGIIDKLPYLQSLGINTVWLTPFCKTSAYHGYHVTDYFSVDPRFGTEKDIRTLVNLSHQMKIKVICDLVPNHCSSQHPFFIDAYNNPNSEYRDWFIFDKWPNDYRTFLSYKELPKLNLNHKPAMNHIIESARKWLSIGIDGYRIDHIVGLSNQNVKDMIDPLREEFPESVYIAEAYIHWMKWKELVNIELPPKRLVLGLWKIGFKALANDILYKNYIGFIDGCLNFTAADKLEKYAKTNNKIIDKRLRNMLLNQTKSYQTKCLLPTFLDNHDMERFLFRCNDDIEKLKKSAKFQFSLNQPIVIYYGTEVGMTQKRPFNNKQSHTDLLARQPMIWAPSKQNKELFNYYKGLISKKLAREKNDLVF